MFRITLRTFCEEEDFLKEKRVRRNLRDASNPLELPNSLFKQHYRVNKFIFKYLLDILSESLPVAKYASSVPSVVKLAACLRFFAEGGYQKGVGRDKEIGLAQSSFSTVLSEVLSIFEQKMCPKWITWPSNEEIASVKESFYLDYKIPGVIGAVDGTHVQIIPPTVNRHLYYNRKGDYSLNVMLVCDNKLRIRYVDAIHPGAGHDAGIWNTSNCRALLKKNYSTGVRNTWLLGDAGYPLEPWLLTPFRNPQLGSNEMKFNDIHAKCRNVIERTNGVLKIRWICLLGARQLHYAPKKAIKIINVCSALHNICVAHNVECEEGTPVVYTDNNTGREPSMDENTLTTEAKQIRLHIANSL